MAKCPNCAGGLRFDIKSGQLACDYCGSFFDPYAVKDVTDAEADSFQVNVFRCPNCCGELFTTDDSATGFCSYCGSSVVLESRIAEEKRPAYIIPFRITKEDCIERLSKRMKTAVFTPKEFRDPKKMERFRGIYMPYWVYSTSFSEPVTINASHSYTGGSYDYTDYYLVQADVKATVSGLTHDASSSFEDSISEAIAPFPAKDLKAFTPSFLCGFYGDVPDVDASVYQEDVIEVISGAVGGSFQSLLGSKEKIMSEQSLEKVLPSALKFGQQKNAHYPIETVARNLKAEKTMLPVWFLSYRNGNRVAYAVVNGVTGEISFDLPVSPFKFLLASILTTIPLYLLFNLILTTTPAEGLGITILLAMITSSIFFFNVRSIAAIDSHQEDPGFRFRKDVGPRKDVSDRIQTDSHSFYPSLIDQFQINMKNVTPEDRKDASAPFDPTKKKGNPTLSDPEKAGDGIRLTGTKGDITISGEMEHISDYAEFVPQKDFEAGKRTKNDFERLVAITLFSFVGLIFAIVLMFLSVYFPLILILPVYGLIQICTTIFGMHQKERKPLINIPLRLMTMGSSFLGYILLVMECFRTGFYAHDELYYIIMLVIDVAIVLTLLAILKQLNTLSTRPLPQLNREGGDDRAPE